MILTSADGAVWAVREIGPPLESPNAVQYGDGRFVAVGPGGTVITSQDGTAWTVTPTAVDHPMDLFGIAYGQGRFVAVGRDGALRSTNGLSWLPSLPGPPLNDFTAVTFGDGLFVAVGLAGRIFSSPDGQAWTNRGAATNRIQGLAYGDDTYVATSFDKVLTSSEGRNWELHDVQLPAKLGVAAFSGHRFFALSDGVNYNPDAVRALMTSPDGVHWAAPIVWTNTDTLSETVALPDHGNDVYVTVGNSYDSKAQLYLSFSLTSSDGTNWVKHALTDKTSLSSVAFGNGQFLALGNTGSATEVLSSADGATWQQTVVLPRSGAWGGMAYGNGTFVSVGLPGLLVSQSDASWQKILPPFGGLIYGVAYGDGMFVAAGATGVVLTSADGVSWQTRESGVADGLMLVAHGKAAFVASTGSAILQSLETDLSDFRLSLPALSQPGSFAAVINGLTNLNWQLQASTNLLDWIPVAAGIATQAPVQVTDTNSNRFQRRFYRAVLP